MVTCNLKNSLTGVTCPNSVNEMVNTEGMFFNAGNESKNMCQKSDVPDEKHEEACRTSEQRQPFEKREKTLGTNEAESSPKKEPLENWRPSLSESTFDPGMEYINFACLYTC